MRRSILRLGPIGGLALAPAWAWAQQGEPYWRGYGPRMMDWGGTGSWFGMLFGPVFMLLVLAVVIAIVVLLVRWLGGPWHVSPPQYGQGHSVRSPLDILKERYARGEIDKEERWAPGSGLAMPH